MKSLHLPNGRQIQLGKRSLGSGAEGLVRDLQGTSALCAKIYLKPPDGLHERLLAIMRTAPAEWRGDHEGHLHVAWPRQLLLDETGSTVGFLMPVVEGSNLNRLFDPFERLHSVDDPSWRVVIGVAARAARLIARLHEAGIVIGDLSPQNFLVSRSGHVTLIDCDTVQFTDPMTGIMHRCEKLTPEYAAPEYTGAQHPVLTPSQDTFGLAVLICQLLMEGDHPFEGVPRDHSSDLDVMTQDNIRMQNNRIVFPERLTPVTGEIPPSVLPPQVRELAQTCFGEGHRDPDARPSPETWEMALEQAAFELMGCRNNDRHVYHSSLTECVWCTQVEQGFVDRYPRPAPVPPRPQVVIPQQRPEPQPQPAPANVWRPRPQPAKKSNTTGWVVIAIIALIIVGLILLGALL